jgi:predicted nucleotidyltransferase
MRSGKRKENNSAPLAPLLKALLDFSQWLQDTRTPGAVIGGVAASLLGRPRFTRDIDAVILLDEESWAEFLASGKKFGFQPRRSDALEFARKTRVLLLRHASSSIDVDVSIGSLPFEKELIARTVWKDIGGVRTPLPTVEDLIIMKAVAHRNRDLADIESLTEVHAKLDVDRIERWVREFASVLELPEILSDLQSILKRRH